jgi:hypothetical protein
MVGGGLNLFSHWPNSGLILNSGENVGLINAEYLMTTLQQAVSFISKVKDAWPDSRMYGTVHRHNRTLTKAVTDSTPFPANVVNNF